MNDFFVSFPDSNSSAIYHSKCCSTNKFAISYGENNLAKIDGNTAHDDGGEQLGQCEGYDMTGKESYTIGGMLRNFFFKFQKDNHR